MEKKAKKCGRQKVKLQQTQRGQIRVTFLKRTQTNRQTHTLTHTHSDRIQVGEQSLTLSAPGKRQSRMRMCVNGMAIVYLLGVSVSMSPHL